MRAPSPTGLLTEAADERGYCRPAVIEWPAADGYAAGIIDLHFHDLRGTAATMLAEAGATMPEIASITGHSMAHVAAILEKYLARTRALADAAIEKFENAKGTKFANRMQTGKQRAIRKGAR